MEISGKTAEWLMVGIEEVLQTGDGIIESEHVAELNQIYDHLKDNFSLNLTIKDDLDE